MLGIDPGLARVGWGVIDGRGAEIELVEFGAVATTNDSAHPERLLDIFRALGDVIATHQPGFLSSGWW